MNNQVELRNALGNFATGVCVVVAENEDHQYVGMTINSFSSVSLDPSLVLWSIKRESHSYSLFSQAEKYVINVLSNDQRAISSKYARYGDHLIGDDEILMNGVTPVIRGSISYFECKKWCSLEAGDHDVLIGKVNKFDARWDQEPLIFFNGQYREIGSLEKYDAYRG